MNRKTNKDNLIKSKGKIKIKEFNGWLGSDGILRIKIGKTLNEKTIEEILTWYKETAKRLPNNPKILVDLSLAPHIYSSIHLSLSPTRFRKKIVRVIKDVFKNPGFGKVACWGAGTIQRTVILFIVSATRLKNVKSFKTEKEALKWLKEE